MDIIELHSTFEEEQSSSTIPDSNDKMRQKFRPYPAINKPPFELSIPHVIMPKKYNKFKQPDLVAVPSKVKYSTVKEATTTTQSTTTTTQSTTTTTQTTTTTTQSTTTTTLSTTTTDPLEFPATVKEIESPDSSTPVTLKTTLTTLTTSPAKVTEVKDAFGVNFFDRYYKKGWEGSQDVKNKVKFNDKLSKILEFL